MSGEFPLPPVDSEEASMPCGDALGGAPWALEAMMAGMLHGGSVCTNTAWELVQRQRSEWVC